MSKTQVAAAVLFAMIIAMACEVTNAVHLRSQIMQALEDGEGISTLQLSRHKKLCSTDCGANGTAKRKKKCSGTYTDCKCNDGYVMELTLAGASCVAEEDSCNGGRTYDCSYYNICGQPANEFMLCDACACPSAEWWDADAGTCVATAKKCSNYVAGASWASSSSTSSGATLTLSADDVYLESSELSSSLSDNSTSSYWNTSCSGNRTIDCTYHYVCGSTSYPAPADMPMTCDICSCTDGLYWDEAVQACVDGASCSTTSS
mmetsp:Transcript_11535/g.18672  ORF Transcript_11535/g.18672 Transcript_11535/m.18672 type:complete len:261 (+) Transcript_11535:371-1153(+)|eukprot:CAMPEP_0171497572 /NCGR_PEP_ID=MMETSP0958-20121227/7349_1 /TAXON_ID=87120 /ORGANISM="Aurantiochytrium limacinum, Strain ATCCMYA-1381" /LENGTH=260 /DNA_ID=CAMNT_0012031835 /DNA_START=398 /DNA_END=1180 /DNA_ORIENTATION=-